MRSDLNEFDFSTVFLDRDGVLNKKMPEGMYVRSLEELEILPGTAEAVRKLNQAGITVLVASNQRGVALGCCTSDDVNAIHERIQQHLSTAGAKIDRFYFCPHDKEKCLCRKPLTGMFERARAEFPHIDGARSAMIGDSLSDIQFGKRAGMYTLLIRAGEKSGASENENIADRADATCSSLTEAVEHLLGLRNRT